MLARDTLYAAGTASYDWIANAREKSPFILGVTGYDDSRVVSDLSTSFQAAIEAVEVARVQFAQGSAILNATQLQELDGVFALLTQVNDMGTSLNQPFTVALHGYTSAEGDPATNAALSTSRAQIVRDVLVARGLPAALFTVIGEGDQLVPGTETSEAQRALNRSVTFDVVTQ